MPTLNNSLEGDNYPEACEILPQKSSWGGSQPVEEF